MLELVFKQYKHIPITESSILKLHQEMLIHSEKDIRQRGYYKIASNRVEARDENGKVVGIIFDPTPPYLAKKGDAGAY